MLQSFTISNRLSHKSASCLGLHFLLFQDGASFRHDIHRRSRIFSKSQIMAACFNRLTHSFFIPNGSKGNRKRKKLCQNKEITRKDFVRHVRTFCPSRTDSASVPYGLYFPRYIFILTQPLILILRRKVNLISLRRSSLRGILGRRRS